jgi:hypothetical protein
VSTEQLRGILALRQAEATGVRANTGRQLVRSPAPGGYGSGHFKLRLLGMPSARTAARPFRLIRSLRLRYCRSLSEHPLAVLSAEISWFCRFCEVEKRVDEALRRFDLREVAHALDDG